jgi:hypothetical protein
MDIGRLALEGLCCLSGVMVASFVLFNQGHAIPSFAGKAVRRGSNPLQIIGAILTTYVATFLLVKFLYQPCDLPQYFLASLFVVSVIVGQRLLEKLANGGADA